VRIFCADPPPSDASSFSFRGPLTPGHAILQGTARLYVGCGGGILRVWRCRALPLGLAAPGAACNPRPVSRQTARRTYFTSSRTELDLFDRLIELDSPHPPLAVEGGRCVRKVWRRAKDSD
jgi:hypothetical protein